MTFIHTDIHTYTQKRKKEKEKRTDRTNIVIYDLEKFEKLVYFAFKNDTNISSILNNLYESFMELFESESPQKTLFDFNKEILPPDIESDVEKTVKPYLLKLDSERLKLLATNFYRSHVYANSFSQMTVEEREASQHNYVYLWKKYCP